MLRFSHARTREKVGTRVTADLCQSIPAMMQFARMRALIARRDAALWPEGGVGTQRSNSFGTLLACLVVGVIAGTVSEARAQGASKPCTGPTAAAAAARGPALPPYLGFLAGAATGINTEYAAWDERQFPAYGARTPRRSSSAASRGTSTPR
jgi:hypothetical protein